MLSLFYSFWQEFQKDKSRFVLLGEQGASLTNLTQEDFSTIQPLNDEVELPDFGRKQMILFIPEMNQQAEVFFLPVAGFKCMTTSSCCKN